MKKKGKKELMTEVEARSIVKEFVEGGDILRFAHQVSAWTRSFGMFEYNLHLFRAELHKELERVKVEGVRWKTQVELLSEML